MAMQCDMKNTDLFALICHILLVTIPSAEHVNYLHQYNYNSNTPSLRINYWVPFFITVLV